MRSSPFGKLVILALLSSGCITTRVVDREQWSRLTPGRDTAIISLANGSLYELDSFSFSDVAVHALRGTLRGKGARVTGPIQPVTIWYDSILVVKMRGVSTGATAAMLAAVGAAVLVVALQPDNPDTGPQRPPSSKPSVISCPFIYSYDGGSWRLDSETYAGAIARGLERTDVDNLDRIALADGKYRLRLVNESHETEYTDELALLAVDHPAGTRVIPEADGTLHLVSGGTPASRIRRYTPISSPAREVWDVTFRRPGAQRLALVLKVRNTQAVPFIHQEIADLLGSDVYAWYHEMNTNADASRRTAGWFKTMGGLRVSSRIDGRMLKSGTIPIVGPIVSKTMVVPIDAGQGDIVRIRLESSPLLWEIESMHLVADHGETKPHQLEMTSAVSSAGQDVSDRLGKHDSKYHVSFKGDRVEMEFVADPGAAGMERTIFARTTGHYYIRSDDQRKGNRALVSNLMKKSILSQAYLMSSYRSRKAEIRE